MKYIGTDIAGDICPDLTTFPSSIQPVTTTNTHHPREITSPVITMTGLIFFGNRDSAASIFTCFLILMPYEIEIKVIHTKTYLASSSDQESELLNK